VLNNFSFLCTGTANALVRHPRVHVLIASSPPFFPHIGGDVLARAWRVPLILEIRDLWPDYLADSGALRGLPLRGLFALERYLLRRAAHVVVVTESFRRRVIDKGVAPERITVIPNGVDPSLYFAVDEAPPMPALVRRDGEFLVGYLGNIGAGQGLLSVLDAAAILAHEAPGVRVVIAGDGPERARLVRRLAELALANVTVHPPIPKSDTRAFYNACDACLVPLAPVPVFQETVPSKIFEIMACERPVIAALEGEGARIVAQSEGGVHVPPGDPRALAAAVMAMRARPADERRAMGRAGRAYAVAHYGRDQLADRYLDLVRRLTAPRAAAGDPRSIPAPPNVGPTFN
jgi:glycosyltransferase involved in cell wall biosynthesis